MSSQGASSSLLPAATPGDFLVEGKLKLRLRGNTSISRANIHSIDNSTRLLIPQENSKHNLLFQDEELTGTEVVTKAAKSLISYITNPPGLNFNCRIPFPVNLTYRRLLSEGNDLSKNADFVYLALVHKELREKFPVSPKELLGVFTDWMAQWPSVSDVLDMDRDRKNLLESRRKKLRKIPRFEKSEELLGKVLGVLEVINSLGWDDEFVLPNVVLRMGSDVPQGLPTEYMTGVFRVKNLLENRDVVRMLARICRVTEKSASSPVREHLRRTLDMVIACDPDHIIDIEDGILTTATVICTETAPKCVECPLKSICNAYKKAVLDAVFLRLFIRAPHLLPHTLSGGCENGKECLLCSLDPSTATTSTSPSKKGVMMYPWKAEKMRRHEAVCIVVDQSDNLYCFVSRDMDDMVIDCIRQARFKIPRFEFSSEISPSAEATMDQVCQHVRDLLLVSVETKISPLRTPGSDYISVETNTFTGRFFFEFSVKRSSCERQNLSWVSSEDLSPDLISTADWTDFQNFIYCRRLSAATEKCSLDNSSHGDDYTRLRLLYEALVKRAGAGRYPT